MQKVSTLVSVGWVAKQILSNTKNLCVLDASWHLPAANRDPLKEYHQQHIPGAQFFDIDKCAAPGGVNKFSNTLPTPDVFSDYVGNLGIDNDTHVVVYENNEKFGVFSAPRAWWMFRVFGHSAVSIMDGGLPLWTKEGHEMTDVVPRIDPVKFRASYQPNLFKSFTDIENNMKERSFQVMDARAEGRFKGIIPEPREGIESGHMPNSISLPFSTLVQEKDGAKKFKPPDQLREVFESARLDLSKPITATCGSGITACVLAMGAHLAGKEDDVAVYDGAWEEYYIKMKDTKPECILKG